MEERLKRTALLVGEEGMEKLKNSHVAVFGVGGVGGFAAEALARSGVGEITLVDSDTVKESNINRQIIALSDTLGRKKVDVMKERIGKINENIKVNALSEFYMPGEKTKIDFSLFSYIVDAIDTVTAKIGLIMEGEERKIPVISSMGTGNKLNPSLFKVSDIYKTKVCPLARVMRYELKKRGIKKLKVVYSEEEPIKASVKEEGEVKASPGSSAFCPAAAGLIIASEVVSDIIKRN